MSRTVRFEINFSEEVGDEKKFAGTSRCVAVIKDGDVELESSSSFKGSMTALKNTINEIGDIIYKAMKAEIVKQ
jgi:hypothetical protein